MGDDIGEPCSVSLRIPAQLAGDLRSCAGISATGNSVLKGFLLTKSQYSVGCRRPCLAQFLYLLFQCPDTADTPGFIPAILFGHNTGNAVVQRFLLFSQEADTEGTHFFRQHIMQHL